MSQTPAGWYPDTNEPGTERYWNGTDWTQQTRPAVQPPPPASSAYAPSEPPAAPEVPSAQVLSAPAVIVSKTPAIVIWGFILSLFGVCGITAIVGLILSIIGRKKAKAAGKGVGLNTAAFILAGLWIVILVVSSASNGFRGTDNSTASVESPTVSASPNTSPTSPSNSASASASPTAEPCAKWRAQAARDAKEGNAVALDGTMRWAESDGCTFKRPKLSKVAQPLPTIDGVAFKWADNPNCDYFSCFGMTVIADSANCPNGFYAELNLLDSSGAIVGYTNDSVGSLRLGQKAKLIFNFTDDDVKTAEISKFSCY